MARRICGSTIRRPGRAGAPRKQPGGFHLLVARAGAADGTRAGAENGGVAPAIEPRGVLGVIRAGAALCKVSAGKRLCAPCRSTAGNLAAQGIVGAVSESRVATHGWRRAANPRYAGRLYRYRAA